MVEIAKTGKRFGMPAKQLVHAIYKRIRKKHMMAPDY